MRNCKNTSHLTAKIPFLHSKNTPPSSITCTLSFSQFVCIPAHNKRFIPVCKQEALNIRPQARSTYSCAQTRCATYKKPKAHGVHHEKDARTDGNNSNVSIPLRVKNIPLEKSDIRKRIFSILCTQRSGTCF